VEELAARVAELAALIVAQQGRGGAAE